MQDLSFGIGKFLLVVATIATSGLFSVLGQAEPSGCDKFLAGSQSGHMNGSSKKLLRLDAGTVLTDDSMTRDGLTALANTVTLLGHYEDASLIWQILKAQKGSVWDLNPRKLKIIGVDGALSESIYQYLKVISDMGPLSTLELTAINQELRRPEIARLLTISTQAILLDGAFAFLEGNPAALAILKQSPSLNLKQFQDFSRTLSRNSRSTPFGLPTDDSQFLISGYTSLVYGTKSFSDVLVDSWLDFDKKSLWRNTGARFKSFLNQDKRALSGAITLGDLLRLTALVPFDFVAEDDSREFQLSRLSQRLNWPQEKLKFSTEFLNFLQANISGQPALAERRLDHLIGLLPASESYLSAFLEAAKVHLLQQDDFAGFLNAVGEHGNDFDTYAYLAPFFARNAILKPTDFRFTSALNRHYFSACFSSLLSTSGNLSVDKAIARLNEYVKNEGKLRLYLDRYRRSHSP